MLGTKWYRSDAQGIQRVFTGALAFHPAGSNGQAVHCNTVRSDTAGRAHLGLELANYGKVLFHVRG